MTLDLSGTTQLATNFTVTNTDINGNGASKATDWEISANGIVSAKYADGTLRPKYQLALADVASPDNLTVVSGNAYEQSSSSGTVVLGFPNSDGFGSVKSGTLENSIVDLASELTEMIEAQKSYTANSKVFQTGSELLDVLVNLQQ